MSAPQVRDRLGTFRDRLPWFAAGILLAALVARLWSLGVSGLWVDEAYTVWLIDAPLGEIVQRLKQDDAPPLYYFMQKAILIVLGDSEAAVRLLSVVASWCSVLVVYGLVRRCAPRAALPTAIALGFSSVSIFYAQQARSYTLVHALTAALIASVLWFRDRPSRARGMAVAGTGLALLYTHNLGLWPLAAGVCALLPELRRRVSRIPLLWTAGALGIGAIPWLASLMGQAAGYEINDWMGWWWSSRSMALAPLYTGIALTNGTAGAVRPPVPLPALDPSSPVRFLLWAIVLAGIAPGAWAARGTGNQAARAHENPAGPANEKRTAFAYDGQTRLARVALVFLFVPLLGLIGTTYLVGPAYVVGRTDTLVLPGFAILLGLGWSALRVRWVQGIVFVIWILAAMDPLAKKDAPWSKGSDRALAALLAERVKSGDAILVPGLGRPSLEYYSHRQGWKERLLVLASFPRVADKNPAAVYPTPIDSVSVYVDEARALRRALEERGATRVWCVAVSAEKRASWPSRPTPPPADRKTLDANAVAYPMSILVHSLVGLEPVSVVTEFRQDWVSGDRVLLEIPRAAWVDPDSLPSVEIQR